MIDQLIVYRIADGSTGFGAIEFNCQEIFKHKDHNDLVASFTLVVESGLPTLGGSWLALKEVSTLVELYAGDGYDLEAKNVTHRVLKSLVRIFGTLF